MIKEGDIVRIPLPDGRDATGWILHVSKRTKNAAGFIVFGIEGQHGVDVKFDLITNKALSIKVLGPLYTHVDNFELTGCKVIAHQPISDAKRQLTRRRIGGGVYVGDDFIGSSEELGETDLRPMLLMGMPGVYSQIEDAFGKATSSKESEP